MNMSTNKTTEFSDLSAVSLDNMRKINKSNFKIELLHPKWCVCFDKSKKPIAGGKIIYMDSDKTQVDYMIGDTKQTNITWKNECIKVYETEGEARQIFENYNKKS